MTRLEKIACFDEHKNTTRICILIKSLANGGAEKQSILLAKALNEKHTVHFVILNETPQHHAHLSNLSLYNIQYTYLKGSVTSKMKHFVRLLKTKKIDLLFTYLPGDTFFGSIGGRLAGVPFIYGGLRNARIPEWRKRMGLRFVHNYLLDATISNSVCGKNYYKANGFNDDKTLVIHNGMVIDTVYQHRLDPKVVTILSVGRFAAQKDYETAIKTIALLKKSSNLNKPFRYIIIGEGQLEGAVRNWIKKHKCEDVIEVVIDPDNINEYYQKSDIYLCSSILEGLSNTLIEASSHSMPIVATDAGDNNQLVIDGENGYITPTGDVPLLAEKLTLLINNYHQRLDMGKAGYEHLVASFSYEKFCERYLDLVEKIMAKETVKTMV